LAQQALRENPLPKNEKMSLDCFNLILDRERGEEISLKRYSKGKGRGGGHRDSERATLPPLTWLHEMEKLFQERILLPISFEKYEEKGTGRFLEFHPSKGKGGDCEVGVRDQRET